MFKRNYTAAIIAGLMLPMLNQVHAESVSSSTIEEIKVLAHPLADNGTAQTVTVLSGEELAREVQATLGETLSGEAGIQSASFGTCLLYTSPSPRDS